MNSFEPKNSINTTDTADSINTTDTADSINTTDTADSINTTDTADFYSGPTTNHLDVDLVELLADPDANWPLMGLGA